MSIQERLATFTALARTKLAGSVVAVVYKGDTFNGLARANNAKGEKLSFSESDADITHLSFDVADTASIPKYGDMINVAGVDRLIKNPIKKDAFGVSWIIEHIEAYELWTDVTNVAIADDPTIYERVKVRLLDPESQDYAQFESNSFNADETLALIRVEEWANDTLPAIGFILNFDDRDNLYVSKMITQSGDYRLICKPVGGV